MIKCAVVIPILPNCYKVGQYNIFFHSVYNTLKYQALYKGLFFIDLFFVSSLYDQTGIFMTKILKLMIIIKHFQPALLLDVTIAVET